ncbi:MarR family winged helix-turn-helix transcriptional regulator [Nonomuraea endophytica]|uniref:DNA-binding MarR family transcriptional regulator n=1 Tax=Nonomuraea endophytica TaxID=714136 RepID=A0A7W8ACP9_9ACTN|nr:MarR family winged helix-turn-helix transcriptional regulator [Nonomuraea endophytica]MBB5083834.1 DNA-binding MarR family transcriptional regulator [Nonomuraea endophytica]
METARLLTLAERQFTQRISTALTSVGGTVDQWRVLGLLADGQGHPMTQVAEHVILAAPTVTKIVDKLVSQGLVYRRVDDADRRRVLIYASARGKAALRRWETAVEGERARLEQEAGEDLAQLAEVLTRIVARLS